MIGMELKCHYCGATHEEVDLTPVQLAGTLPIIVCPECLALIADERRDDINRNQVFGGNIPNTLTI